MAGRNAYGGTIFVARVGKSGTLRNSKPCKRCQNKIDRLKMKVVHT